MTLLLLKAGADVNRTDNEGFSSLYEALAGDNDELAAILIAHGASRSQVDRTHRAADRSQLYSSSSESEDASDEEGEH